jgi:dihydrofolate reductase
VKLALIVAVSRNLVIGKSGKLPWHISEDLKRFKRLTTGHTVLMGRKTFESIGRPLSKRRNVVLTTRMIPGVETYESIPTALHALRDEPLVFVIGGGDVYRQTLAQADLLFLTLVDQEVDGDTFFPPYTHLLDSRFTLIKRMDHDGYSFLDYERRVTDL